MKLQFIFYVLAIIEIFISSNVIAALPTLDSASSRWLMPADSWQYREQHNLKGKFLRISFTTQFPNQKLRFYKDKSLRDKVLFEVDVGNLSSQECLVPNYKRKSVTLNRVLDCTWALCAPLSNKEAQSRFIANELFDAQFLLESHRYFGYCSNKIDWIIKPWAVSHENDSIYDFLPTSQNSLTGVNYYIPQDGKLAGSVQVKVNGKNYFLEDSVCKQPSVKCEEVSILVSDYEKDWSRRNLALKSSDNYFGYLTERMLPCVKARNKKCVEKFLPQAAEDMINYADPPTASFSKPVLNEELWSELEACLKSENLLPHLLGSRGKNKVCIFRHKADYQFKHLRRGKKPDDTDLKLLNVTYPEALRVGSQETIYLF